MGHQFLVSLERYLAGISGYRVRMFASACIMSRLEPGMHGSRVRTGYILVWKSKYQPRSLFLVIYLCFVVLHGSSYGSLKRTDALV